MLHLLFQFLPSFVITCLTIISSHFVQEMCYSYIILFYINLTLRHIEYVIHVYETHIYVSHTL
jgi:hypothetical protein